ncbi:MAG TPA: hypothetical protein VFQ53_20185 [Kofleriaceae bacterium]|nr:hypothetical protein [Kofleriaceae bacterium]
MLGNLRLFETRLARGDTFCEIRLDGSDLVVRTPSGTRRLKHASEEAAARAHDARVERMLAEGWVRQHAPDPLSVAQTALADRALEAQLPASALVYADWLTTRGDPRGALIVMQHAGEERAARKHLARHRDYFFGRLRATRVTWCCGFFDSARVRGDQVDDLIELPSARRLVTLAIDGACALDRVLARLPHLASLVVRADRIAGPLAHRSLRTLELVTSEREVTDVLDDARLPALAALTLRLGPRWTSVPGLVGWRGTFRGRFRALRTLTLDGVALDDVQLDVLVHGAMLRRLASLTITNGALGDLEHAMLARHAARFAHLATFTAERDPTPRPVPREPLY